MQRSWDSNSNTTSTTDSTSDASGSVTGGYISIPQVDSSLDGVSIGRENIYKGHHLTKNYGPLSNLNYESSLKADKLLSLKRALTRRRQHYKGQLRLDIYLLHGYVTVHVIAGRNIHSKIQDPPNSYVVASIIPESTYLCPCKSSTYWHSSRPVYDEKISIEIPNNYINRRLYITLSSYDYTLQTGDEMLGCLSFGLDRKTKDGLLSSGWFYVLEGEVGRVRHVRVLDDVAPVKSYFSLYNISKVLLCRNVNNGGFGFSVYGTDRVRICRVDPGSSAHHHSLHRDDLIMCIDGVNVIDMPPWEVANIIRNAGFYMNLIVRRGEERKADCEQDKIKNAIIANCIKKIINQYRNINDGINLMNVNGNNHGGFKGEDGIDFGASNEEGSRDKGSVFMGKMVDYGWLEDESTEKRTAQPMNKKKESRRNIYKESFEAKKFSKILKIRAFNQDSNAMNIQNTNSNDQLNGNYNKIMSNSVEDSNRDVITKKYDVDVESVDVGDDYVIGLYDEETANDEDLFNDAYDSFSLRESKFNKGTDYKYEDIESNRKLTKQNRIYKKRQSSVHRKENIIKEAHCRNIGEGSKVYNRMSDLDADALDSFLNVARVAFKDDKGEKILVGSDNVDISYISDGKDEDGTEIYETSCQNLAKELDTIQEVTEADVRQTSFHSGCSSLLEDNPTDSYLYESLASNDSFENNVVSDKRLNSMNPLNGTSNERVKASTMHTDEGYLKVVSKNEGFITPRGAKESQTFASLAQKRHLVASDDSRVSVLRQEDKENIPCDQSSPCFFPSSIKSISTPSKSSKPPLFTLLRNSARRKQTVAIVPNKTLLSSTTSLPMHVNEYDFINNNLNHNTLNNNKNNKNRVNNNISKDIVSALNNEIPAKVNDKVVCVKDGGLDVKLDEADRMNLKRHGSFRNSAFVSKIRSAFKNKKENI